MKDKIREICYDLEIGCIDWTEASEQLFALCDVVKSLPTKEEMVTKWYNKVFKNNFKFRKVFKDIVDDAYYSGALDMHKELTK